MGEIKRIISWSFAVGIYLLPKYKFSFGLFDFCPQKSDFVRLHFLRHFKSDRCFEYLTNTYVEILFLAHSRRPRSVLILRRSSIVKSNKTILMFHWKAIEGRGYNNQ